ncbi:hypothetical protein [uncultured Polaribacter sp.]|uniref:DUF6913 domain-containing protein n=1 Tax=uncultured Polaribacter sp. TaxID=174711 RepID=UPI002625C8E8|nr:hypothetical protein [uncultured Polaribacter sp.]
MLQGFKEKILKKKLLQLISNQQQKQVSEVKKIQTIGIVTSLAVASKINLALEIERELQVKGVTQYNLVKVLPKEEITKQQFTEKDINLKGEFTQPEFKNFLNKPFDLLIGYFSESNVFLESAVAQSKARFKVGFSNVNEDLYLMEFSENIENVSGFLLELKKYLIILNKL